MRRSKLDKTENTQSRQRPLRVLFVMGALDGGGAEKVLVELLDDLDRARIQPSLFLLWRRGVYLDKVPPDVKVSWGVEKGELIRNHARSALMRLLKAAEQSDIVVGSVELLPSYIAWLGAAVRNKPVLGWVHQDLHRYIQHRPLWDRTLAFLLYRRFDKAVVLTEEAVGSLHRCTGLDARKVCVLPNYINAEAVRELAFEATPSWAAPIMAKPFVMGLGRLENRDKGWDILLRAHALVRSQGIDHNLVILGEGPDRDKLENLAVELGVRESCFLPGYQRNPFCLLKHAVALVAGARLEGFGLALVEAMALGVPVVASNSTSGPVSILEGGKYGSLVGADDVYGFAAAMGELLSSTVVREEFSRRAILRARDFDIKTAKQWETILWSVAK